MHVDNSLYSFAPRIEEKLARKGAEQSVGEETKSVLLTKSAERTILASSNGSLHQEK